MIDVKVQTSLGPITVVFVRPGQVYCRVDAHINDDKPALVYRGQDYIGSVHLALSETGEWQTRPDFPASWSKRPQWKDAPRTHEAALTEACRVAVIEYLDANPDTPRAVRFAEASKLADDAQGTIDDLTAQLKAAQAQVKAARLVMDATAHAVRTWADDSGVWHAAVTVPSIGYASGVARSAQEAIGRELVARGTDPAWIVSEDFRVEMISEGHRTPEGIGYEFIESERVPSHG